MSKIVYLCDISIYFILTFSGSKTIGRRTRWEVSIRDNGKINIENTKKKDINMFSYVFLPREESIFTNNQKSHGKKEDCLHLTLVKGFMYKYYECHG